MTQDKNHQLVIGVLAFQGDFAAHQEALKSLGHKSVLVKSITDLENLTHLILPGGESTVISKFLISSGLDQFIKKRVTDQSLAVYGSCAGAILSATEVESKTPVFHLGLMNIHISRNAYGAQIHSFETELEFLITQEKFNAVFIRAPKILSCGESVKILCQNGSDVVAAQQGRVMVSTFHPELIRPAIFHQYFLGL